MAVWERFATNSIANGPAGVVCAVSLHGNVEQLALHRVYLDSNLGVKLQGGVVSCGSRAPEESLQLLDVLQLAVAVQQQGGVV